MRIVVFCNVWSSLCIKSWFLFQKKKMTLLIQAPLLPMSQIQLRIHHLVHRLTPPLRNLHLLLINSNSWNSASFVRKEEDPEESARKWLFSSTHNEGISSCSDESRLLRKVSLSMWIYCSQSFDIDDTTFTSVSVMHGNCEDSSNSFIDSTNHKWQHHLCSVHHTVFD